MNRKRAPTYEEFLREVNRLMSSQFGVTTGDTGDELVAAFRNAGGTPQEVVEFYAGKYELDRAG